MKILHINEYYRFFGGTEKYLLSISKSLEGMGHEIIIISSSEREPIHVPGRKEYFVKGSCGLRSSLAVKGFFKEIIENENPDIIHLHNTQYFVSSFILKYLHRVRPVVKTVHDTRLICPAFRSKLIPAFNEVCNYAMGLQCFKNSCYPFFFDDKRLLWNLHKFLLMIHEMKVTKRFDKILVPSFYVYNELIRNGFSEEKITVIPLYVDDTQVQGGEVKNNLMQSGYNQITPLLPSFARGEVMGEEATPVRSSLQREKRGNKNIYPKNEFLQRGTEEKTILYIGRLDATKGIIQFIESLNLLKHREWQARIIGEGNMRDEAKAFVEKLGLEERVTFLGYLSGDEINKYLAGSNIVVMPSMIPESFGLVGIEAMAVGNPVVAFDVGGIREWLVNGETGFLIERGNIREMAAQIARLLGDDLLAREMGKRGKERVEKYYRKDIHLQRLLTIYADTIRMRKQEGN